ncbi:MAG: hypothetical protein Fur0043_23570 [Anaerolineales bacterium]
MEREECSLKGHAGAIYAVATLPGGHYILSGGTDKIVRLWDIEAKGAPVLLEGNVTSVHSIAFSPNGRYAASGSQDGTICIWEFDWEWEFD